MRPIVFVVDASARVGMGHLSRCLVLARELASHGADCSFLVTDASGVRSSEFPMAILEARANPALPSESIVVLDGYCFGIDEIRQWRNASRGLVLIDDFADRPCAAEIVVNHNVYAGELDFSEYDVGRGCYGPKYALIRSGFRDLRNMAVAARTRVLVSFGGGATARLGEKLIPALFAAGAKHIDIALGSAVIDEPTVPPGCSVELHPNADMVELLGKAGVFVGSLGVTFLEVLAANRELIGVQVADNQHLNFLAARRMGMHVLQDFDPDAIAATYADMLAHALSQPRMEYPDGDGASRVATEILRIP